VKRSDYYTSLVPNADFGSILDLGCGDGWLLHRIACKKPDALLIGTDWTGTKSKEYNHIISDVRYPPFRDNVFSLVTAVSVLEHVPVQDRSKLWIEWKRIMRDGGRIAVQVPNRYFIIETHSWLPFLGFFPASMHSFDKGNYTALPSLKELIKAMERVGLPPYHVIKLEPLFVPFAKILKAVGILHVIPFGYLLISIKSTHTKKSS
jgi:SAM-dependent methyltransferase